MTKTAHTVIFATALMIGMSAGCGSDEVEIGHQNDRDAREAGMDAGAGGTTWPQPTGGNGGSSGLGGVATAGGSTGVGGFSLTGGASALGGSSASGGATQTGGMGGAGAGGTADASVKDAFSQPDAPAITDGSDGASTTCASMVGQSCASQSCCAPLLCSTQGGSATCHESYPPPSNDGSTGTPDLRDGGAIMSPTLPAACATASDCCMAMDSCLATAYLVGKSEFEAMKASIAGSHDGGAGMCVSCTLPAIQVQCQAGFCVGERVTNANPASNQWQDSHCGTIAPVPSSGGSPTGSPAELGDAGTSTSTWHCGV